MYWKEFFKPTTSKILLFFFLFFFVFYSLRLIPLFDVFEIIVASIISYTSSSLIVALAKFLHVPKLLEKIPNPFEWNIRDFGIFTGYIPLLILIGYLSQSIPILGKILAMPGGSFSAGIVLISICGPQPNASIFFIVFVAGYYLLLFLIKSKILQRFSFFREHPIYQYVLLFIIIFIIVPLLIVILNNLPYFSNIFCT